MSNLQDTHWTLLVTLSWMNGKVISGYMRVTKREDSQSWEQRIAQKLVTAAPAQVFMLSPSVIHWKPVMIILPSETFATALVRIEEV